jgi:choline dehydrogenase-like flavoprotein
VGDDRWGYEGLLPYFRRSEHHFDSAADPKQHGFDGPMYTSSVTSSGRKYPLRDTILKAWKRLGLEETADANNGTPQGIAELVENRRDGLRQLTSVVYSLQGAHLVTETMVGRIMLTDGQQGKVATGVELADKRQFHVKAGGEVILCGGAYRSPQILMLSGIGDQEELARHGISQQVDLPWVGKNFHDHQMIFRYWKVRHPEKGLAMGSPALTDPAFNRGNPADWLATTTVPQEELKAVIAKDEGKSVDDDHVMLKGPRSHLEMNVLYAAFGAEQIGLKIPVDGTAIMSYYMACLPTSRGSITLGSADPEAPPVIDPNYCATEADRFVMREGWRVLSRLMLETPEGQDLVADEIRPEGQGCLPSDASDADIDARIKIGGMSCSHPAASCSMGKVVDGSCRVFGVHGLRVVDASVIPVPLAAHYQVPVFALAEQAVDIILAERR